MKSYVQNGITFVEVPVTDFKINMVDKKKKNIGEKNYCNGGFFGNFDENKSYFTLPAGHLIADVTSTNQYVKKYCKEWGKFDGKKVVIDGSLGYGSNQFKNKSVTTFSIVNGKARVDELLHPIANADYSIIGVPVVRKGNDVKFYGFVTGQGWDGSTLYATSHIFLATKKEQDDTVYIISYKSKTSNLIYSGEMYKKLAPMGFYDVVKLDGGGSHIINIDGKVTSTLENRQINTIIEFGSTSSGNKATTTTASSAQSSANKSNPYKEPTKALKIGAIDREGVRWIQWELCRHRLNCEIDGSFGPATDRLVRTFQKDNGLAVDGSVGPATRKALKS